jgi:FAD/FMN-containing dehydrogenase
VNPAIEGLISRLGTDAPGAEVSTQDKDLAAFADITYPSLEGAPAAIVRPDSADDVRLLVDLARDSGVSLVPASSAAPHVKGGTSPVGEGLIVDMSGMDRILRVDRRNKVAIVEPGVTFGQLRERLAPEGLRAQMPLLPREGKSVIGSYIEREPTIIPKNQWDMTDPLLCVEVVFGTGDVFRTGSAAGPGSLEDQWGAGNAQKNPMGPAATDLLKVVQGAQGTMGMVTWASIALALEPAARRSRFVTCQRLEPLVDLARELCRKKLGDEMFILDTTDASRLAACASVEAAPVEDAYTLAYAVAGYPGYLPEERVRYQEADIADILNRMGLRPRDRIGVVSSDDFASLIAWPCPGPHWKVRGEGACQDVFFLTTMDRAPKFVEAMEGLAANHGIERPSLGVYLQPVQQGRSCHLEFNIFFDPKDSGARDAAHRTAADAARALAAMGAFFSRPYEPWTEVSYRDCADVVDALNRVKRVFDPQDIMNRDKLCFRGGASIGAL